MNAEQFASRRAKLRKLYKKAGAQGMLITNFTNVTYLTGFTGDDSFLLLADGLDLILSDARYETQLEEECPDVKHEIRVTSVPMAAAVAKAVQGAKVTSLAIEANSMTVASRDQLVADLPKVELLHARGLVEELREIKSKEEIDEIRLAVWQAERAFAVLRATLRPDRTEKEVADDLEHQIRLLGGKGCSFSPIVAVAERAALPHARPTERKIGSGDFVLVDWGATARHYRSDLTRVLATSKISPKLERVYGVVLKAQLAAIDAIRPGKSGREIDAVARGIIADEGFGKRFGHGLGHGIGIDIHEGPRLSAANDQPLKPGMVVTVEPGVYLPGWGGVRIEDDVLITKTGCEVLTSVAKALEDCVVV